MLHVSNHTMFDSGLPQVVRLGEKNQIHRLREFGLATDVFLIGSILIMAIYHLALYGQRREDKSTLYFAIMSVGVVLYTMLIGESFLFFLFPWMNVVDLFRVLLPLLF